MLSERPVLITGASGFLGSALARRLAGQRQPVKALVRTPAKATALASWAAENDLPLTLVYGDLSDAASLAPAVEGCSIIFHCAALLGGHIDTQRRVNVEGTRMLALAAAQAGIERFVHVSTLSVYGVCYDGVIHENLPAAPCSDPYGISKSEAEAALRETAAARGLAYTIIRPGMIYGPYAELWTKTLFRLATLRPLPWFGEVRGFAHCIHVEDVIDMLLVTAQHPAALGEAFNCVSDPAPSWRVFLGELSRLKYGEYNDISEFPASIAYLVAGLVMLFSPAYSRGRMAVDYLTFINKRVGFSMEKSRQKLGWEPQIDIQTGIESCIPWLRAEGLLP